MKTLFILEPSTIEGVGVFAVRDVPAGSILPLFAEDERLTVVDPGALSAAERVFLRYGVRLASGLYSVPEDFSRMSVGWFLNHSRSPNVVRHGEDVFVALRDVAAGEELTIDYSALEAGFAEDQDPLFPGARSPLP